MNKISKKIEKELRLLAIQLPITYREQTVLRVRYGQALLNEGIKEVGGKPVDPDAKYSVKVADKVPISNRKRLFKIYERDGMEGVRAYVDGVLEVNRPQNVGTQMGGLVLSAD